MRTKYIVIRYGWFVVVRSRCTFPNSSFRPGHGRYLFDSTLCYRAQFLYPHCLGRTLGQIWSVGIGRSTKIAKLGVQQRKWGVLGPCDANSEKNILLHITSYMIFIQTTVCSTLQRFLRSWTMHAKWPDLVVWSSWSDSVAFNGNLCRDFDLVNKMVCKQLKLY